MPDWEKKDQIRKIGDYRRSGTEDINSLTSIQGIIRNLEIWLSDRV